MSARMDNTPQQESKHDSEVPIFSASTAEEDDDVDEYVEEEEDEDLEAYDEETYEQSLDELAKEIRTLKSISLPSQVLSTTLKRRVGPFV